MKKEINANIIVEKNKDCEINIINKEDELSFDSIYKNAYDIDTLEDNFNNRIEFSNNQVSKKLLPKKLQNDFKIEAKMKNGDLQYETIPKTIDAYEKYPYKINFSMKFDSIEQAEEFKKNGIKNLFDLANSTGHAVEIPNIINMKDLIGDYQVPTTYINRYGFEGSKLFICPTPKPPANLYAVNLFCDELSFEIKTKLRIDNCDPNNLILTNRESIDEPFDITLKFLEIEKSSKNDNDVNGKFFITIKLKDKYKDSCLYNGELLKYNFLCKDSTNILSIFNEDIKKEVFNFKNVGDTVYNDKDYDKIKKIIKLIKKIIYLEKTYDLNIKYDIEYFLEKAEFINILYNETNGRNYHTNCTMTWVAGADIKKTKEEIFAESGKLTLVTNFATFDLFDNNFELSLHELILKECKVISIEEKNNMYEIKLQSNNIDFILDKNKG